MRWRDLLVVPVMLMLAVVQLTVLPRLPLSGYTPQLLLLVALAWAMLRGLGPGLSWAFAAGMVVDLFSISPMGVSALSYMAAAAVVVGIKALLPPNRVLVPMFLAAVGTSVTLLLAFFLLRLLGYELPWRAASLASPLILVHGLLVLPLYWLILGLERLIGPHRVELA
jgi:rod shape-determining protein MreD